MLLLIDLANIKLLKVGMEIADLNKWFYLF